MTGTRDVAIRHEISLAKTRLKQMVRKVHISGAISLGGGTNPFMATKLMEGNTLAL